MPVFFYKCNSIWYNKVSKGTRLFMKIEINNFVIGAVSNEVKKLYLSVLYSAEDLQRQGKLSDEDFQFLRKRILDYGNNAIRNLEVQLDNFDFTFKNTQDI